MNIISFILFLMGLFIVFGLSPEDFTPQRKTLRQRVKLSKQPNKGNAVSLFYHEIKQVLHLQGVKQPTMLLLSLSVCFAVLGAFIGILLDNVFLVPILSALFCIVPTVAIKLYWNKQEQQMNDKLEAALNAITTSYLRGNNTFIRAIEENIEQIEEPVKKIFKLFLLQANFIDSSITDALQNMKVAVHNPIFHSWIDTIERCQSNQTLKPTLPRILDKFTEQKTVLGEMQLIMEEPKRTYYIMLGAAFFAPFLLYFLNKDWWNILLYNPFGKALLAFHLCAIGVALVLGVFAMRVDFGGEHE